MVGERLDKRIRFVNGFQVLGRPRAYHQQILHRVNVGKKADEVRLEMRAYIPVHEAFLYLLFFSHCMTATGAPHLPTSANSYTDSEGMVDANGLMIYYVEMGHGFHDWT